MVVYIIYINDAIKDNEIYLLIKYIKSVLWRVAKCLSYIEEARCLKVNTAVSNADNVASDSKIMNNNDLENSRKKVTVA